MKLKLFSGKSTRKLKAIKLRKYLVSGVLVAFSFGLFLHVFTSEWALPEQPLDSAEHKASVKQYAGHIAARLQPVIQRVTDIASQPTIPGRVPVNGAQLLRTADPDIPELLNLYLLGKDTTTISSKNSKNLTYACLDLAYEASQKPVDSAVPVEAHLFGNAPQHIDIARAVYDENGKAVGAVLASISVRVLKGFMPQLAEGGGYLELQQARQTIAIAGRASDRELKPYTTPIKGTRWRLAYWPVSLSTRSVVDYAGQQLLWVAVLASLILVLSMAFFIRETLRIRRLAKLPPEDDEPVTILQPVAESVTEESSDNPLFQTEDALIVQEADEEEDNEVSEPAQKFDMKKIGSIFKAYDIRGIVGTMLTEDIVYEIGLALGSEAQARDQKTMVVGRDGRLSGETLLGKLSDGLRASGMDVIDIGLVPTPLLYFAAETHGTGSGVMVTGSHNPPNYNGLKMVIGGTTLAREDIQTLKKRIEEQDYCSGAGEYKEEKVVFDYIKRVTDDVMLLKRFKVVIDCGNGAAGVLAPTLLKNLGCDVVDLYCDVDGTFPNHHPDPSRPENLKDLIAAVKEHDADIGLAFDGDGDRLGVVTSEGKVIWPDRVMMLYAMDILSRNKGGEIIFDVKCSTKLKQVIEQHGGKATMWNTGHSLIKSKMKSTGALLAGEMSGHIFFKERWYGFDDALYSAARLIELLGTMTADKTVAGVFNSLPDSVNTPELNIAMAEGKHHEFIEKLLANAKFEDAEITTLDGLRVDFADGWGLVRASNTTPNLVLRFEADDDFALQRIMSTFRNVMLKTDSSIKFSF